MFEKEMQYILTARDDGNMEKKNLSQLEIRRALW